MPNTSSNSAFGIERPVYINVSYQSSYRPVTANTGETVMNRYLKSSTLLGIQVFRYRGVS